MSDKHKSKKISGITPSERTRRVAPTDAVRSVDAVRPTAGVHGVQRVGNVRTARSAERALTQAERERLLTMIREEADKLFAEGALPATQKEIVKQAVMMAVDASIILEGDASNSEGVPSEETTKPKS